MLKKLLDGTYQVTWIDKYRHEMDFKTKKEAVKFFNKLKKLGLV